MPPLAAAAVILAFVADATVREYPERLHPVVAYGTALDWIDRDWRYPSVAAGLAAVGLPILAAGIVAAATALAGRVHPVGAVLVAGGALFASTSRQLLVEVAVDVVEQSTAEPAAARDAVPALVGRDPEDLTADELRSAAVESAAENLADGLVAPLLAFVVMAWSLPLAAGAAAWVKAVNTGDSMLGYRTHPLGRPFARLDDTVMWLPARLTAVLIAIVGLDPHALVRASRWARRPPSPNAGWPMATLATLLEVRLEKPDAYRLNPAATLPTADLARRGIRIVDRAGLVAFASATVVAWL